MDFDDLPLVDQRAVDRACNEFEADQRAGRRPRVEDYLDRVPEAARPALLKELQKLIDLSVAEAVQRFGRYRVIRLLGEGGFGRVYLARDEELGRDVALKVPHADATVAGHRGDRRIEEVLAEARKGARLKHPGIVAVYDVGRDDAGIPYLVLEYIEGGTLDDLFRNGRIEPARLAGLIARVAEAVQHAHTSDLIHRDLKPSNILLDRNGDPHVSDFGLAIDYDPLRTPGEVAGTFSYMAPEQVRGESHRLDGRTDIWAIGVILYRGLTGRLPFPGRGRVEIADEILNRDPLPPYAVTDSVPRELDRICLKCLSRRMNDRYQRADDLAKDLRRWLESTSTQEKHALVTTAEIVVVDPPSAPATTELGGGSDLLPSVVPRGLQAYDRTAAAAYLTLIPGPRGRDGLPESLRFWEAWARSVEDDGDGEAGAGLAATAGTSGASASVGLLYGPSGGGKSSFVRAGLIPRLREHVKPVRVEPVYVEAAPSGTEPRLLAALRRVAPGVPDVTTLPEAVAAIRQGRAGVQADRVLIVLDQFEQWLQAYPAVPEGELARALRQCDGRRVQALVLVRDDFWMAVTRFFQALEVPLVEGMNSAAVELLDVRHTRTVLQAYGRACGRFTGADSRPSDDEAKFVAEAAAGLAGPNERVVPVRLSLFTEVVRRRTWSPTTLEDLGGVQGIGVKFLEEAFDVPSAPPAYKRHYKAAQAVLQTLLPPPPSLIRRAARPASELREAALQADPQCSFDDLLRVLGSDLRLISQLDPEGLAEIPAPTRNDPDQPADDPSSVSGSGPVSGTSSRGPELSYQLAHDYLVLPVRQWVERKMQATRPGRARLLLATTSAVWADRPGPRRLPSIAEWGSILWFTGPKSWSPDERRMMRAATRHHLLRGAAAATAVAALTVGYRTVRDRTEANALYAMIWGAKLSDPAELFHKLDPYRGRIAPRLAEVEASDKEDPHRRAVATALLHRYEPTAGRSEKLRARLLRSDPDELALHRAALATHPDRAGIEQLWSVARDDRAEQSERLRAAAALAGLDPVSPGWKTVAPVVARTLRSEDRTEIHRWAALLDPARDAVVPALRAALLDRQADLATCVAAAEALIEIHGNLHHEPAALAALIPDASPDTLLPLVRAIDHPDRKAKAAEALELVIAAPANTPAGDDLAWEEAARRQARAVAALAVLGSHGHIWPRLSHDADPPARWILIDQLARTGVRPKPLLDRLSVAGDPCERQGLLLVLADMATVLTAWSGRDLEATAAATRSAFAADPDPGVHSAAELLLRRLGHTGVVRELARKLPQATGPAGENRWFVGPNDHTFAVTGPLEGWVGTKPGERGHHKSAARHFVRTGRYLAVATAEVTVSQYREFLKENPGGTFVVDMQENYEGVDPETAMGRLSWYEAVRYCNWLSKKVGLEACYPEKAGPGMTLDEGSLDRLGFRLPTEAEWELFCRTGTLTARPFGSSDELLPRYAWTWLNSDDKTHPVAQLWPTRLGLFDIIGNQWEWCHDGKLQPVSRGLDNYPEGTPERPAADRPPTHDVIGEDQAKTGNTVRLHRGGAHDYAPSWNRSGSRDSQRVFVGNPYDGLRVVRTLRVQ
jgi:serine/threonine protein kinase/formylglycine-generating enzyme required for sulfatase activity